MGLLWEFPGGKVERGEDPKNALKREIQEELCFAIDGLDPLPSVAHTYDFGHIELLPYLSVCVRRPNFMMTEHVAARWIAPSDWESLNWAPADIPIIKYLLNQADIL